MLKVPTLRTELTRTKDRVRIEDSTIQLWRVIQLELSRMHRELWVLFSNKCQSEQLWLKHNIKLFNNSNNSSSNQGSQDLHWDSSSINSIWTTLLHQISINSTTKTQSQNSLKCLELPTKTISVPTVPSKLLQRTTWWSEVQIKTMVQLVQILVKSRRTLNQILTSTTLNLTITWTSTNLIFPWSPQTTSRIWFTRGVKVWRTSDHQKASFRTIIRVHLWVSSCRARSAMPILICIRNIIQTFKGRGSSRFQPLKERRELKLRRRILKARRSSIIRAMSQRNLVLWETMVVLIRIIIATNEPRSNWLLQQKVRTSSSQTETKV